MWNQVGDHQLTDEMATVAAGYSLPDLPCCARSFWYNNDTSLWVRPKSILFSNNQEYSSLREST